MYLWSLQNFTWQFRDCHSESNTESESESGFDPKSGPEFYSGFYYGSGHCFTNTKDRRFDWGSKNNNTEKLVHNKVINVQYPIYVNFAAYNIACYSCTGKNCEEFEQCQPDENVCSKTDLNGIITRSCHTLRSNEKIGCNVAGNTIQCYCNSNYCNSASAFSFNLNFVLSSIGIYFRLKLWW